MNNLEKRLKIRGIAFILTTMCHSGHDCPISDIEGCSCPFCDNYGFICSAVQVEEWEKYLEENDGSNRL